MIRSSSSLHQMALSVSFAFYYFWWKLRFPFFNLDGAGMLPGQRVAGHSEAGWGRLPNGIFYTVPNSSPDGAIAELYFLHSTKFKSGWADCRMVFFAQYQIQTQSQTSPKPVPNQSQMPVPNSADLFFNMYDGVGAHTQLERTFK